MNGFLIQKNPCKNNAGRNCDIGFNKYLNIDKIISKALTNEKKRYIIMPVRGKKNPRFNKFKEDKNNGKIYSPP